MTPCNAMADLTLPTSGSIRLPYSLAPPLLSKLKI